MQGRLRRPGLLQPVRARCAARPCRCVPGARLAPAGACPVRGSPLPPAQAQRPIRASQGRRLQRAQTRLVDGAGRACAGSELTPGLQPGKRAFGCSDASIVCSQHDGTTSRRGPQWFREDPGVRKAQPKRADSFSLRAMASAFRLRTSHLGKRERIRFRASRQNPVGCRWLPLDRVADSRHGSQWKWPLATRRVEARTARPGHGG